MSVYIDELRTHEHVKGEAARYGKRWCHMIADTEDELHIFAGHIGMQRRWAQYPGTGDSHYDLVPSRRARAVAAGAIEIGTMHCGAMMVARRAAFKAGVRDLPRSPRSPGVTAKKRRSS